jgi:hypothetical protein
VNLPARNKRVALLSEGGQLIHVMTDPVSDLSKRPPTALGSAVWPLLADCGGIHRALDSADVGI